MRYFTYPLTIAACALPALAAQAAPIQWTIASGGNGHYYDLVNFGDGGDGGNWELARSEALSSSHLGSQGYLATFTSAEEQEFFISAFVGMSDPVDGWFGATDAAEEGKWIWADGPEACQQFWEGAADGTALMFASWLSFEPNNSGGEEHFGAFNDGEWTDYTEGVFRDFYLVEFDAPEDEEETPPDSVPEPATLLLLGAGLAGLGAFRRRR